MPADRPGPRVAPRVRRLAPRARLIVWLVLTGAGLYLGWLEQPAHFDDTLIPVRYARNLVAGHGWVFNPGSYVNGSTSMLNTLLTAGLGWLGGGRYVFAQIVIFGVSLGALAFFVYLLFRPRGAVPAAVAVLLAFATPYLYWTVGLETSLLLALGAGSVWAFARGRPYLCAVLVSLMFLARGDGALLVLLLLAAHVWAHRPDARGGLGTVAAAAVIFAVIVGPWLVYSYRTFGTVFPQAMRAKLAQTESGLLDSPAVKWNFSIAAVTNLSAFLSIRSPRWFVGGFYVPTTLFAIVTVLGSLLAIVRRHPVLLLQLWACAQFFAYGLLNPPNSLWYFVPSNLFICLSAAVLFETLWTATRRPWLAWFLRSIAVATAAAVFYPIAPDPFRRPRPLDEGNLHYGTILYDHYRDVAAWLREHVPAGSSVACLEIGVLGYELPDYVMVDMLGLVTRGGARAVARGDFTWWIDDPAPAYVVLGRPPWQGAEKFIMASSEFHRRYELIRTARRTRLFRRR